MTPHNNRSYTATIVVRDDSGNNAEKIVANLPESISVAVQSNWEARLPFQTLSSWSPGNVALDMLNFDALIRAFTFQSWRGSGPLEFNLMFQFAAEVDAGQDVVQPVMRLQRLVMPSFKEIGFGGEWDGLLLPPGPSLIYPNCNRISLRIGRLMYIPSVILRNVEAVFDTAMDSRGKPNTAVANVTFMTINTPSREELEGYFNGAPESEDINNGGPTPR